MEIFKYNETAAALELVSASLTESESKVAELEAKVSGYTDLTAELETARKAISEFEAHGIEASNKLETVTAVVDDVLKRHAGAHKKVKIIHPPAPQITLNYR